jgi:hypothetical protein
LLYNSISKENNINILMKELESSVVFCMHVLPPGGTSLWYAAKIIHFHCITGWQTVRKILPLEVLLGFLSLVKREKEV